MFVFSYSQLYLGLCLNRLSFMNSRLYVFNNVSNGFLLDIDFTLQHSLIIFEKNNDQ